MTDPSSRIIGRSIPRTDAYEKVTGQAMYPGDLSRPGMLHMKILFAGRPHARIAALDSRRARAVPGVVAVLTAEDVPVNSYGLDTADQPVLCGDVVRFEGDQVAAVVAETEDAAARARDLIEVVYEDLPVVTDPREAMRPGSPAIHADHPDNVLQYFPVRKGDIAQGFARADAVVSGIYYLPMQEHAYLQPEAGLAYTDGDQVVVETAGQWAHHDQRQIARALSLDPPKIRVIYRAIGGAFGGREDLSVQIVLALAVLKTGRPVKIVWSREESIRGHCKRHQMYIRARWGATREGKLTAAEVEVIGDAGAYNYTSTMVLGQAVLTCTGGYEIPNVHVDAYMVHTNNVPGGAFRGFGSPQGLFAAEGQIEKLAEQLGIDPITMRERNLLTPDSLFAVGTRPPADLHLERLLEVCAGAAGWTRTGTGWARPERAAGSNPARRRGTGLAIGLKNVGFSFGYQDDSVVTVELRGEADIEEAVLYYAGAECGQGTHTAVAQMAAEALGLPLDRVRLVTSDTAQTPEAGSASASRLTLMAGNAVIGAAEAALERWRDEDRPAIGTYTYHAPPTRDYDPVTGNCFPNFAYGTVAQAVEVEVDTESGEVTVPRVISVVDVGRAINPHAIEGQVEGAVAQGLGYALLENYITQDGASLTPSLSTYLLPTTVDMPPIAETHILELDEPLGPWGASGVGEHSLIGVPAALAAAVKDAAGRWIDRLPLTPSTVLDALAGGDLDHSVES
jgi:CO/xanthine dehydrogenase Mo-binding subunit